MLNAVVPSLSFGIMVELPVVSIIGISKALLNPT